MIIHERRRLCIVATWRLVGEQAERCMAGVEGRWRGISLDVLFSSGSSEAPSWHGKQCTAYFSFDAARLPIQA